MRTKGVRPSIPMAATATRSASARGVIHVDVDSDRAYPVRKPRFAAAYRDPLSIRLLIAPALQASVVLLPAVQQRPLAPTSG